VNELHTGDAQAILVKQWWHKYGTTVIVALILAILSLSGYRFWKTQQENTAAQASLLYDQYQMALNMHNVEAMSASYNTLKKDYKRTPYATAVSLIESARQVQADKLDEATETLEWVVAQGHDYAKPLARLRLAEIKVQQKNYDAALDLLKNPAEISYAPAYQEMTGDVLLAQGNMAEALAQYTLALKGYQDQGFDNVLLQYKLQSYSPTKTAGGQ
jgi:predicted negative regulator of RcsB-dependent stress response